MEILVVCAESAPHTSDPTCRICTPLAASCFASFASRVEKKTYLRVGQRMATCMLHMWQRGHAHVHRG